MESQKRKARFTIGEFLIFGILQKYLDLEFKFSRVYEIDWAQRVGFVRPV